MLKYKQLKNIALSQVSLNSKIDLSELAKKNGIDIRTQDQCNKNWKGGKNPLIYNEALLTYKEGRYIIYYDESSPYAEFYFAHEISHYLLKHYKDSEVEEFESNMMACILIASIDKIIENNIVSDEELANTFKIPISKAIEYRKLLLHDEPEYLKHISLDLNSSTKETNKDLSTSLQSKRKFYNNPQYIKYIVIPLAILSAIALINLINTYKKIPYTKITDLSSPKEIEIEPSTLPPVSSIETTQEDATASDNAIANNLVYVTSSGEKYHIKGCRYIKNKTNIKELSTKDALDLKYQPCSVCIK